MITNTLIAVDGITAERQAAGGEVKRLGDKPIVIELAADGRSIEVAARPEHHALATRPFATNADPATAPV